MDEKFLTKQEIIDGLSRDCISCGRMLKLISPEKRRKYAKYVLVGQGLSARVYYMILYKLWDVHLFLFLLSCGEEYVDAYLRQCADKSVRHFFGNEYTRLSLFKTIVFKRGEEKYIWRFKELGLFDGNDECLLFELCKNVNAGDNPFLMKYIRENRLYPQTTALLTKPGFEEYLDCYIEDNNLSSKEKRKLYFWKFLNKFLCFE